MFCLQVKEYKKIVDNTVRDKCEQIISTFILVGSECEINIDSSARSAVLTQFNSKEPLSLHIFDNIYAMVFRELQVGHFPRFVRKLAFRTFIAEKGDFLRYIGYDMRIEGIKNRIMYQPDDLSSNVITDRDIKMALHMNQDSPDWDLISKDGLDYQVFRSMKQYIIGVGFMFRLLKTTGLLPVSYDKAIMGNNNFPTKHLYDPLVAEYVTLDYIKAGQGNNNPYSQAIVRAGINYSPFHIRWYYNFVSTVVHDGERNCFIEFGKSSTLYNDVKKECNKKKSGGYAIMVYSRSYYRVAENKTRYIEIIYIAQDKFQIERLSKFIALQRAKGFHHGMLKVHEEMAKRDYQVGPEKMELHQTLLDFRDKYETDGNLKTYELSRTDDSQ
jgi:hypothetical protein